MQVQMTIMSGVNEQICPLCHYHLSFIDLLKNKVGFAEDDQGFQEVMVKCPICKREIEWEWVMH
jgi:RNase P subunit RPR2